MPRRRAAALITSLLVSALVACAEMHEFSAAENEKLLKTAGFRAVAADTPEKVESLNTLAAGKISRVGRGDKIYYVFNDPFECRCLWVGQESQYERYRRLETEAMVPSVDLVGVEAEPDWFDDMEPW
jgi:hypothetical protein